MTQTTLAADEPPRYPTDQCNGCHAPIIWAITNRCERMPVDAEPVGAGDGNVLLRPHPTGRPEPLAQVVSNPAGLFGQRHVYRSHFATCPKAAQYRRTPRRRAAP